MRVRFVINSRFVDVHCSREGRILDLIALVLEDCEETGREAGKPLDQWKVTDCIGGYVDPFGTIVDFRIRDGEKLFLS